MRTGIKNSPDGGPRRGSCWNECRENLARTTRSLHVALCTLKVIKSSIDLDENKLRALDPCKRNDQGEFVAMGLPPQKAWREQITVYKTLSWRQFKHTRRQKYLLLVCYHQVEISCFFHDVVPHIWPIGVLRLQLSGV